MANLLCIFTDAIVTRYACARAHTQHREDLNNWHLFRSRDNAIWHVQFWCFGRNFHTHTHDEQHQLRVEKPWKKKKKRSLFHFDTSASSDLQWSVHWAQHSHFICVDLFFLQMQRKSPLHCMMSRLIEKVVTMHLLAATATYDAKQQQQQKTIETNGIYHSNQPVKSIWLVCCMHLSPTNTTPPSSGPTHTHTHNYWIDLLAQVLLLKCHTNDMQTGLVCRVCVMSILWCTRPTNNLAFENYSMLLLLLFCYVTMMKVRVSYRVTSISSRSICRRYVVVVGVTVRQNHCLQQHNTLQIVCQWPLIRYRSSELGVYFRPFQKTMQISKWRKMKKKKASQSVDGRRRALTRIICITKSSSFIHWCAVIYMHLLPNQKLLNNEWLNIVAYRYIACLQFHFTCTFIALYLYICLFTSCPENYTVPLSTINSALSSAANIPRIVLQAERSARAHLLLTPKLSLAFCSRHSKVCCMVQCYLREYCAPANGSREIIAYIGGLKNEKACTQWCYTWIMPI